MPLKQLLARLIYSSMAATRNGKLAGDRRENRFYLAAQSNQHRNGDHGDERQDQGVLDQGLAFFSVIRTRFFHIAEISNGEGHNRAALKG
jgi:hypothetical protein